MKFLEAKLVSAKNLLLCGNNRDKSKNIETIQLVENGVEAELTVNIKLSYT